MVLVGRPGVTRVEQRQEPPSQCWCDLHSSLVFLSANQESGPPFPPHGPNPHSRLHLPFAPGACVITFWPFADSTSTTASCHEALLLPRCGGNYGASSPTAREPPSWELQPQVGRLWKIKEFVLVSPMIIPFVWPCTCYTSRPT